MPDTKRRTLILSGAAIGAGLLLYWQPGLRSVDVLEKLLQKLGGRAEIRTPGLTGSVNEMLARKLWLLFTRIAARWQLSDVIDLDERAFVHFLYEKTAQAPSYLTEYREAGEILDDVEPRIQANAAAFDQFFIIPAGMYGFETTRLGRFQKFVIAELIELQIAFGGFRAFGYRNYRGFAGGPLSDPANPPYRSL